MGNFERSSSYERVNRFRDGQREKQTGPDFGKVKQLLQPYADVFLPGEAIEPVLTPDVQVAIYEWLTEIRSADKLKEIGEKARRTCLLEGEPGGGKTTAAKHLAGRLGLPLACVRSESLISKYLGETGQAIGGLFNAMAQVEGQVVIFIDEFDSIGSKRSSDQGGGATAEMARSLNVLLRRIEMANGIIMAATNRKDMLDPAMQRRFELNIEIGLPGPNERFAIVKMYADPFDPSDEDVDLLSDLTAGAPPALIEKLVRGAKRTHAMWEMVRHSEPETAGAVFQNVIQSVKPTTGATIPPLWENPVASISEIDAHLTWPWPMKGSE